MKNELTVLKIAGFCVAIFLGVIVLLIASWIAMLLFGGPFSDAQFSHTIHKPVPNIAVSERDNVIWDVDDRIAIKFDNGFSIKNPTCVADFPCDLELIKGASFNRSGERITSYFVKQRGDNDIYVSIKVDEGQVVRQVWVDFSSSDARVEIVDLASGKSVRLFNKKAKEVVQFFQGLSR